MRACSIEFLVSNGLFSHDQTTSLDLDRKPIQGHRLCSESNNGELEKIRNWFQQRTLAVIITPWSSKMKTFDNYSL